MTLKLIRWQNIAHLYCNCKQLRERMGRVFVEEIIYECSGRPVLICIQLFGSLCAAYAALCAAWLAACAARWRDLLRIQYWIGAVALLGMAETAAYYAVYADVNRNGYV